MKKSLFIIITLMLSVGFLPLGTAVAHNETSTSSQYIGDKLPRHHEFNDLTSQPIIEKTVKANILDENGRVIDEKTFEKTGNSDNQFSINDQGTKKVTVLAVADEEYRNKYPDWQNRVQSIVEKSDDAFNRDHNIDFEVKSIGEWESSGQNSEEILSNLSDAWDGNGYDFVVGFTDDRNFDAGGIAYVYGSKSNGSAISVNLDQGTASTAKAAQHEFSHNFGLGHDPQGSGIKCIMNYDYAYSVDYWDPSHAERIQLNKVWYGN
ncbi:zinc-dependent metalloprotease [Cytobacillus horneckiae]|uniref:zinc-dependent metalloprotease n=1 Tax=Cytobacillus horneckiae TaxID=549687 RepID=UPI0039A2C16B